MVTVAETEISLLVSPTWRLGSLVPLLLLHLSSPFPTPSLLCSGRDDHLNNQRTQAVFLQPQLARGRSPWGTGTGTSWVRTHQSQRHSRLWGH